MRKEQFGAKLLNMCDLCKNINIKSVFPQDFSIFVAKKIENIMEINQQTLDYIKMHRDDDVRQLALSAPRDGSVDVTFALNQISGMQVAKHKLPAWYACDGVIYPPHISMEQCSSETTARYKAEVMRHALAACGLNDTHLIDMTGGFGVDFSFMAQGLSRCTYVEQQPHLCDIARHNMPLLSLSKAEVVCGDGVEYISGVEGECSVFIDPARRDANGNRTYAIADCTPDVIGFIDKLVKVATVVMIKLSPMLDWHATVRDINKAVEGSDAVREVHIVSTANECKELLIVVSVKYNEPMRLVCVNDDQVFEVGNEGEDEGRDKITVNYELSTMNYKTLSLPNASVMKAGCFDLLCRKFGVRQISKNSHIFLSDRNVADFPGKTYRIEKVTGMGKKELRQALQGIDRANIATRNFPMSPDQLRKRLKLKDGGDLYIFATTDDKGEHLLFITTKH